MSYDANHSVDKGLHHLSQRLNQIIGAKMAPESGWSDLARDLAAVVEVTS